MSKKQFPSFLLTSLMLMFVAFSVQAEPVINKPAPLFSAPTADGKTNNLADFHGKTVILEWTNNECPFVKKHYETGNIPNLQKQAAAQDVVWLQIISSAPGKQGFVDGATAKKLNEERGATPTNTLFDPEGTIGRLYIATNTPQFFIINPEGILLYKGAVDSIPSADKADIAKAENYISAALSELATGKAISKNTTKPYGCTVKYAS